jgi:hypothetical protein
MATDTLYIWPAPTREARAADARCGLGNPDKSACRSPRRKPAKNIRVKRLRAIPEIRRADDLQYAGRRSRCLPPAFLFTLNRLEEALRSRPEEGQLCQEKQQNGGEEGIRTLVGLFGPHPISSRRRYDRFGTSPARLLRSVTKLTDDTLQRTDGPAAQGAALVF